jgi:hypothetical protein
MDKTRCKNTYFFNDNIWPLLSLKGTGNNYILVLLAQPIFPQLWLDLPDLAEGGRKPGPWQDTRMYTRSVNSKPICVRAIYL